ncbi:MAG: hypothetical protein ABF242_06280 [Flavobacteriales bacterium]
MSKTLSVFNKIMLFGILFFLTPFFATAEAGKGITDEAIILALLGLVVILINQIYLLVTSMKKIMEPEKKSSIIHYISFVISIAIFVIYFPNRGDSGIPLFEAFVVGPFILGVCSFLISLFIFFKKK